MWFYSMFAKVCALISIEVDYVSGYTIYTALSFPKFVEKWFYSMFAKAYALISMEVDYVSRYAFYAHFSFLRS